MAKKISLIPPPKESVQNDMVIAWSDSALFNVGQFPRYNPDDLVGRKGLRIYDYMMQDEQVKAVVKFKRDAITAREWTFKFDDAVDLADEEKERRINLFQAAIRKMSGSFNDALNCVARGMYHGFSLTEKVYTPIDFEGTAFIGISALLPRPAETFFFYVDEYGVLEKLEQQANGKRQTLDPMKFIHYVHNPEYDSWYGRSDLREAYRSWFAKDALIKLWLIYLERFGGGFAIAKQGPESALRPNTPEYEALTRVINNIRNITGMILPKGIDLVIEKPAATDQYQSAIEFHDLAIAKALLVPNLLGITNTGQTGAYAQSQTQLEAFFWTLNADSQRLAGCLNEQLFRDLGDLNWGDGKYPEFTFKPASAEQIKWVIQTWQALMTAGAVTNMPGDEEHIRKLMDMPSVDPNDIEDEKLRKQEEAIATAQATAGPKKNEFARKHGDKRLMTRTRSVQFAMAVERVQFTVIDHQTETAVERHVEDVAMIVAKAVDRVIDRKRIAEVMADPSMIQHVKIDASDISRIKKAFIAALSDGWMIGVKHASNEISTAKRESFRADFKRIETMAAEWFESNGFRLAGNLTDGMKAIIMQELQNAVKYSWSPEQARATIYQRLIERGMTDMAKVQAVSVDDVDSSEVYQLLKDALADDMELIGSKTVNSYIRTLARTNMFEALNEARYAYFTDPRLGDFVEGFEYSAILDDRTTALCAELDGKRFKKGSAIWEEYRPPNHFNCRSVLVPIIFTDEWSGRESVQPKQPPAPGFGKSIPKSRR